LYIWLDPLYTFILIMHGNRFLLQFYYLSYLTYYEKMFIQKHQTVNKNCLVILFVSALYILYILRKQDMLYYGEQCCIQRRKD